MTYTQEEDVSRAGIRRLWASCETSGTATPQQRCKHNITNNNNSHNNNNDNNNTNNNNNNHTNKDTNHILMI